MHLAGMPARLSQAEVWSQWWTQFSHLYMAVFPSEGGPTTWPKVGDKGFGQG